MDWKPYLIGLSLGWLSGFLACYVYFVRTRLMRTRSEYYADQRSRGLDVPDDWDESPHPSDPY